MGISGQEGYLGAILYSRRILKMFRLIKDDPGLRKFVCIDLLGVMLPNYRRCVSCRKTAPKSDFWRIVRVYPSGTVELDQGEGRSVYLCPQEGCLRIAQKKNRLGRSLKACVPEAIYQILWQRISASSPQS